MIVMVALLLISEKGLQQRLHTKPTTPEEWAALVGLVNSVPELVNGIRTRMDVMMVRTGHGNCVFNPLG